MFRFSTSIVTCLFFASWLFLDHAGVIAQRYPGTVTPTINQLPTPQYDLRPTIDGIPAYGISDRLNALLTASLFRLQICSPTAYEYVHRHVQIIQAGNANLAMPNHVIFVSELAMFDEWQFPDIDEFHGMVMLVHEARHIDNWVPHGDEPDANRFSLHIFDDCQWTLTQEQLPSFYAYKTLVESRANPN